MPYEKRKDPAMTPSKSENTISPLTIIKRLVMDACCIFTVLTLLLLLIQWLIEQNLEKSINAGLFLMLLPLSLCISGARMIRTSEQIPTVGKVILHPLLCLGGIFLVYIPYMNANHFPAGTALLHMLVFAIVYSVITAVVCIISMATHRRSKDKDDETYLAQFNTAKNNRKD